MNVNGLAGVRGKTREEGEQWNGQVTTDSHNGTDEQPCTATTRSNHAQPLNCENGEGTKEPPRTTTKRRRNGGATTLESGVA
ncbi:hypothetical protein SESBI_50565 [Sesbania bispinosa]|nr:hypothetical protein SESBI_50565 [Sesbania bispinosa]